MKDILDYLFNAWTTEEIRGLVALITLLGIIIGVSTFIIERNISSCHRKKDNRKKWMIDIIISPEIENINKYFEEVINNFEVHINDLSDSSKLKQVTAQAFLLKRAEFIAESHNFNKIFINTFVALIGEYDKNVGGNLKTLVSDLTDAYTNYIGNLDADNSNYIQEFSQKCNLTKARFYRELFKVVDY